MVGNESRKEARTRVSVSSRVQFGWPMAASVRFIASWMTPQLATRVLSQSNRMARGVLRLGMMSRLQIRFAQARGNRAGLALAHRLAVDARDRQHEVAGAGEERFARGVGLLARERAELQGQAEVAHHVQH